ncbi:MAG: YicC family protein [Alphaproteobacteria bacterium]|nr:YicC family protein [Alphaproteobacteria bacterium]
MTKPVPPEISSMTGFGRATGQEGAYRWTWEVRSVNGRGLDVRCRVPQGFEVLEASIKPLAAQRFDRGNINLSLTVQRDHGSDTLRVNEAVLKQLIAVSERLSAAGRFSPVTVDGLFSARGVIEIAEAAEDDQVLARRDAAIVATATAALDGLLQSRRREGEKLGRVIQDLLAEIGQRITAASTLAEQRRTTWRERFSSQVDALLTDRPDLSEERLNQEVALLMVKGDVSEELARLTAHVTAVGELMAAKAPGRKLDFLCQELNREANTLCSKSSDVALTAVGVDLKVAIDRLREQVQNLE